eukprot:1139077-Pelagomonas_calceolata.AAC.21
MTQGAQECASHTMCEDGPFSCAQTGLYAYTPTQLYCLPDSLQHRLGNAHTHARTFWMVSMRLPLSLRRSSSCCFRVRSLANWELNSRCRQRISSCPSHTAKAQEGCLFGGEPGYLGVELVLEAAFLPVSITHRKGTGKILSWLSRLLSDQLMENLEGAG